MRRPTRCSSGTIIYGRQEPDRRSADEPARELNMTINVQVNWTHNPPTEIEDKQLPTTVTETINFVPEVGETTLSATNHVIQSLAKQIVDMMESPGLTRTTFIDNRRAPR